MPLRRSVPLFLLGLGLSSCMFGFRSKTQQLKDLGTVELPSRLEPRSVAQHPGYTTFNFDRTSGSFLNMGSSRPINENLVLAVWDQGHQEQAVDIARKVVHSVNWRKDGPYEIADGMTNVNARDHKLWAVLRQDLARRAVISYIVWQETQSLDEAKRTVDEALASLRLAQDRPAKPANPNRANFQKLLDARGLQLQLGGPVVELQGCYYLLTQDDRYGESFLAVCPLGDLPNAASFRVMHDGQPKGVNMWPEIVRYSLAQGEWTKEGDLDIPPPLFNALKPRHVNPQRSYFYAVVWDFPADSTEVEWRTPSFWRAIEPMKARFARGEMVKPIASLPQK